MKAIIFSMALLGSFAALAAEDMAHLYEVTTQGSSEKLKAGEQGKFVLEIKTKDGAYVSEEAPLKLAVTGQKVKPGKDKLTMADSVAKKSADQKHANPKFEVPVTGEAQGKGAVDAKLTFFLCTEKSCLRQQKNVSVPVEVN